MKVRVSLTTTAIAIAVAVVALLCSAASAFTVIAPQVRTTSTKTTQLHADATQASSSNAAKTTPTHKKSLGLITFDLDDTLYPIEAVLAEANTAFAASMESFGYAGIQPKQIVETGILIREEIAATDAARAAVLTHTEIRELAIRREMEKITLQKKLKACADDWATPVSSLSPIVVQHAKK